jgi:CO/xanthine dehydrogenase Mo-binding subunit/aerobic-type carbon monoxide dehydrogenase small subunit (CoxS/CutS family)
VWQDARELLEVLIYMNVECRWTSYESEEGPRVHVNLSLNHQSLSLDVDPQQTLLRFLRDERGLAGTKDGCSQGQCGTCTVLVDGVAKRACLLKMGKLEGVAIVTIEGLSLPGAPLTPVQRAFVEEGAIQCGFCTPGMVMAATALLDAVPHPTDEQIRHALRHNLCRCTGYAVILRAIHRAAGHREPQLLPVADRLPVGTSVVRKDVVAKVRGEPVFADDRASPGALHGVLKFSDHVHARLLSVDTTAAQAQPGVALFLTGKDVPGRNAFGLFVPQQPVICTDEVKYLGDVVAVVFAETRAQAEAASDKIVVDYEVLPVLDDPRANRANSEHVVHRIEVSKGEVETAFAGAAIVVEGHYTTQAVEHAYLETESCLVEPSPEGLTVWTGNQGSLAYRSMIAASLAIPEAQVRVVLTACGGAFGGKEEPTVQIPAALGALRTGRAVRMVLTRAQSIRMSTKRHPMQVTMKHAADAQGNLLAVESSVIADSGAYLSQTKPVVFRSAVTAPGPYVVPHVKADSTGVFTHSTPSGAFRGFGSTQASFAAEIQMDKLARALGLSPADLRRRNAFATGLPTATGQLLGAGTGYRATLESAASAFEAAQAQFGATERPAHVKVGFGLASSYKNVGIGTGLADAAGATIEIAPDGRVTVFTGAADLGQGSDTLAAQIAAQELQLPYESIEVVACDTSRSPDGGMTTASRQTYVTGNAVRLCAAGLKARLDAGETPPLRHEFTYLPPVTAKHQTEARIDELGIHYGYCFASVAVAVEVDTQTGKVKVLKVHLAQDVGKALHPQNLIGQIEGSALMGIGLALTEEFRADHTRVLTDTLAKLGVPTIADLPELEAVYLEIGDEGGPYGAKGMGEVGLNPLAPAISNAIFDAVGVRLQHLPMTPEKVLAALGSRSPA